MSFISSEHLRAFLQRPRKHYATQQLRPPDFAHVESLPIRVWWLAVFETAHLQQCYYIYHG